MKRFRNIILALVILSLLAFPLPAIADGESPWGEILNPDGSIRWDLLSDLGTVSESADWMDITLPGGMVLDLDATYHRYQTPSGNILVLPSPATLFFMAMHPVESGLAECREHAGQWRSDPGDAGRAIVELGTARPTGDHGLHRSAGLLPGGDRWAGQYLVDRQFHLLV